MAFAIDPGQTVLFVGDSITDCGRRGQAAPLGNGYVRFCAELIDARYPGHKLTYINRGIGGNTVKDLEGRWHDDVLREQPDWLSVKIGINDLHRHLANADTAVPPDLFASTYDGILGRVARETSAKLILIDPFYISTETHPGLHRTRVLALLPEYIAVVETMAAKYNARRVKTHDLFQAALQHTVPDRWCPEPVHPYDSGHHLIAQAWLAEMGW